MRILGISAFYHDSAAALIEDGRIVSAAQEERFTRKKYDSGYPANAIDYCLAEAGIRLADVDHVAFYDKPLLKFHRLFKTYMAFAPRGFRSFRTAMPVWLNDKLFQKTRLGEKLRAAAPEYDWERRILFSEHHLSHAASAFFPSPFEHAVILTMDGVGEWATTSAGLGNGNRITMLKEIHFPHSLGLLYSSFTDFTGFRVNSGEYKVMGLAPYGEPRFTKTILDHLIDLKDDGSFRLNQAYFEYCTGFTMTNRKFAELFGVAARKPQDQLEQIHMDLAASIQDVTEEGRIAAHPFAGDRNRSAQPLPRGRGGAQLCRQRQGIARRSLRECLGAARGRRCGWLARRRPCGLSPRTRSPASAVE
jgi:carbamoyltransferase